MIESLFFSAYYSYLKGNLEDTRMYLSFMKEESKGVPTLNSHYVPELKRIIAAVKTGTVTKHEWLSEEIGIVPVNREEGCSKQDCLVKLIHTTAFEQLRFLIGSGASFHLHNIEHPCDPYGRVDMLYRDSITSYPTEIKKDRGEHDIIGQIMKYELVEKLHLHFKMFYKVQPVTICHNYEEYTLVELKKLGVITLTYSVKDEKISLRSI